MIWAFATRTDSSDVLAEGAGLSQNASKLRFFLRAETRQCHTDTEAAFGRFRLETRSGFTDFLTAHRQALLVVRPVFERQNPFEVKVESLLDDIDHDLEILGEKSTDIDDPETIDAHPVGVSYVLAGSHLGASLLLRSVSEQTDPVLKKSTNYLANSHLGSVWKRMLSDFETGRWEEDKLAILDGARKTFGVFEMAANRRQQDTTPYEHALF